MYNNKQEKVIIQKMEYELPESMEVFIERYKIKEKIYTSSNGQTYLRNYSGLRNLKFEANSSINNYLDHGNIGLPSNWKENLEEQLEGLKRKITYDEKILKQGNFSPKAVIYHENYVVDEVDGEKVRIDISGDEEPVYIDEKNNIENFINLYGELFFNYLGTEEKLLLTKAQKRYGLLDDNTNFLSEIQFSTKLLKKLSGYTKKMFKKDIYLDRYLWGEKILFRVGESFDFIRNANREDSEVEYELRKFKTLDDEGDGIKNFVTSYLTLNLNDKNILLLDEPESFLHPPLAKQLGEIIGESATNEKQIFISTHSVELLKGIMGSCNDVNIIRITREGNINRISQLEEEELNKILYDPLLVSSNILNGLFCKKIYICEAESDEEFYRNIHDKVNLLDSCLFVHGRCKQDLKDIAKMYDELKIKNIRIYDFDILRDADFTRAIKNLQQENREKYINIKNKINEEKLKKEDYHSQGIRKISNTKLKEDLKQMLKELKENGIIILKNGTLETNLEDMGVEYTGNNKDKWIKKAIHFINISDKEDIKKSYVYKWIFE